MNRKELLELEFHQNCMAFEEDLKAMLPYFDIESVETLVNDDPNTGLSKYLCTTTILFRVRFVGIINCWITRDVRELKYTREYGAIRMNKDRTISGMTGTVSKLKDAVNFIMED